jgi:hypothetical protein
MNDKFLAMNLKKSVKAIESQRNPRTKGSTKLGGKIYKIEKRTRKINEIGKQKLET